MAQQQKQKKDDPKWMKDLRKYQAQVKQRNQKAKDTLKATAQQTATQVATQTATQVAKDTAQQTAQKVAQQKAKQVLGKFIKRRKDAKFDVAMAQAAALTQKQKAQKQAQNQAGFDQFAAMRAQKNTEVLNEAQKQVARKKICDQLKKQRVLR